VLRKLENGTFLTNLTLVTASVISFTVKEQEAVGPNIFSAKGWVFEVRQSTDGCFVLLREEGSDEEVVLPESDEYL
tara:strand:+ start:110 stop:337 length:228 start_codon:yes stop_codon:yes gene_type:complete